ncbi:hypothetical protein YPPY34_2018, partial [Yersinia pestis PY-34]
MPLVENILNI